MKIIILIPLVYSIILVFNKCMAENICCAGNALLPLPTQPNVAPAKRPALVPTCPDPFHKVNGLPKCYLFVENGLHFNDARTDCLSKGGDLIKLETDGERQWLLAQLTGNLGIWLGATVINGSLFWLDGTPLTILPGCPGPIPNIPDGDSVYVTPTDWQCGDVWTGYDHDYRYACKRDFLEYV